MRLAEPAQRRWMAARSEPEPARPFGEGSPPAEAVVSSFEKKDPHTMKTIYTMARCRSVTKCDNTYSYSESRSYSDEALQNPPCADFLEHLASRLCVDRQSAGETLTAWLQTGLQAYLVEKHFHASPGPVGGTRRVRRLRSRLMTVLSRGDGVG